MFRNQVRNRSDFLQVEEDDLKVPDNIKNLQTYNGDPKILKFWLESAEKELDRIKYRCSPNKMNYMVLRLIIYQQS